MLAVCMCMHDACLSSSWLSVFDFLVYFPLRLPNLGQTCYINSILQCLFALQPLCIQLLLQEETWRQEPSALLLR